MGYPEEVDFFQLCHGGWSIFYPEWTMDNNRQYFWECNVNVYSQSDRLNYLLDGGSHMDDHTRGQRRKYDGDRHLPSYQFLDYFVEQALERPDYSAQRLAAERLEGKE